jgi:hypothetical protein
MEEKNPKVASWGDGFCRYAAVHIGMAPRFPKQGRTQVIEVLAGIAPFLQDGLSRDRGETGYNDPKRLSGRMGVDGFDARPSRRGVPGWFHVNFLPARF